MEEDLLNFNQSLGNSSMLNDDIERTDLYNDLNNNEISGIISSIPRESDNMISNSFLSYLNKDTNCISYNCPNCKKIPKIVFINDNKIMINCCKNYNYIVENINKFILDINKNKIFSRSILNYCNNCINNSNNSCENCQEEIFYCNICENNLCEDCKKKIKQ